MSYQQTLDWLYALQASRGMDFRLARLRPVLARLGDPQSAFPSIHVAGTNGKGSTAAMLHSIYSHAGYRVGLYTSPHLLSFRERIRIGSDRISERRVVECIKQLRKVIEQTSVALTFFELATLVAFVEFRDREVDLAVVEVGLGGRLDATNVVDTAAAAITTISLDHCAQLGNAIGSVAWEKAGIIRPRVPLITGDLSAEALAVVDHVAEACRATRLRYGRDFGPWSGRGDGKSASGILRAAYQRRNAAVAASVVGAIADRFPVRPSELAAGIEKTRWPGRLEVLAAEPRVVVDAAHNPQAVGSLVEALPGLDLDPPRVLVFGVMADKDWREMICRLLPFFDYIVLVPVEQRRALDPAAMQPLVAGLRPYAVTGSAAEGLALARRLAGKGGAVVVTGSIFLVAEIYRACGGERNPF